MNLRKAPDFHFLRHLRKCVRFWPGVSAFLIASALLVTISIWIAHDTPRGKWPLQLIHRNFWLGFWFGIACWYLAYFLSRKGFVEFRTRAKGAFLNKWFFVYLGLGVLATGFCLYLATAVVPEQRKSVWESFWVHMAKEPGGFFALFTGLPTLVFLALAVQQLWEIKRTIGSFSELIDRVCELAKKATGGNPLRILAYTPAVGYLARPDSEWHQFHNAINKKDSNGNPKAEIICLEEADLALWHNLFVNRDTSRGKIDKELTESATVAAEGLLYSLQRDDNDKVCDTVHRLPTDFMPGYYFFFTKDRAIIVVPLFLPLPASAKMDEQTRLPSVQMIGFETAERALIHDLEEMYDYYKKLSKSHAGRSAARLSPSIKEGRTLSQSSV